MTDSFGRPMTGSYGAPMMDPRGFAPARRPPLKTSAIIQLVLSGMLALAGVGIVLFFGFVFFAFSGVCGYKDCGQEVTEMSVAGVLATVGLSLWVAGLLSCVVRKRGSGDVTVGLALSWLGSLFAALSPLGIFVS